MSSVPSIRDTLRPGPCRRALDTVVIQARRSSHGQFRSDFGFDQRVLTSVDAQILKAGAVMEDLAAMVKLAHIELEESKKTLAQLSDDVTKLAGDTIQALADQNQRIRDARMTAVRELREVLGPMRDLRAFMLDAAEVQAMDRLERFLVVAKMFQDLRTSGLLDAIAELALRLNRDSPTP